MVSARARMRAWALKTYIKLIEHQIIICISLGDTLPKLYRVDIKRIRGLGFLAEIPVQVQHDHHALLGETCGDSVHVVRYIGVE